MQKECTVSRPLRNLDYRVLAEFRYQLRKFQRFSEEAARAAGLEPQQHQLLLAVKGFNGDQVTIGDVAERLQIQHHSAVALVDRTEQRGLLTRNRNEVDRRQVLLRLTDHGEAALRQLATVHRQELQTAAPALIRILQDVVADEDMKVPSA